MKAFLEFIETNEEAKAKVAELDKNPNAKFEDFIALAKEYGFDIAETDFVAVEGELSEEELDSVTGGAVCLCVYGGGGTGDGKVKGKNGESFKELTCACVLGGGGEYYDENGKKKCRCCCVLMGSGETAITCGGDLGDTLIAP